MASNERCHAFVRCLRVHCSDKHSAQSSLSWSFVLEITLFVLEFFFLVDASLHPPTPRFVQRQVPLRPAYCPSYPSLKSQKGHAHRRRQTLPSPAPGIGQVDGCCRAFDVIPSTHLAMDTNPSYRRTRVTSFTAPDEGDLRVNTTGVPALPRICARRTGV